MATFHPLINIDINKSYCIRLNSGKKSQSEINKMLRDLAEDKTNWSGKILTTIHNIIEKNTYNIPYDLLEVHFDSVKSLNYKFENKIETLNSNQVVKEMHNALNTSPDATQVQDVFLQSNPKYSKDGFNDIQLAHIILMLSELAKSSEKLWLNINIQIREIGKALFYFVPEDGHIKLSKRIKISNTNVADEYIKAMNDIIDGEREVPRQ